MKNHSIYIDQNRHATSIVAKYLDTTTVNVSTINIHETTLPADIVFTEEDVSTSDEQVEKLNKEFNIHYRACIGSLSHQVIPVLIIDCLDRSVTGASFISA